MPARDAKIEHAWKVLTNPPMRSGINAKDLPHAIAEDQTPRVSGMYPKRGSILQTPGFSLIDTNTGEVDEPSEIFGTPLGFYEFNRLSGVTESIMVTTETAYRYNGVYWDLLSEGTETVSEVSILTAGDGTVFVNDKTGFATGRRIGIFLDSGDIHTATILATGTTLGQDFIDFEPDIQTGAVAAVGNAVFQAPLFTAVVGTKIPFITIASEDWLVFTNGADPPQRYDGATVEDIPGLAAANIEAAVTLTLYKNYLLLGATKESGVWRRFRVRRSDVGNHSEWVNGDAGFDDLADAKDDIRAMQPLGDYNVVGRARSIILQEFVGSDETLFRFRNISHGSLFESTGVGVASTDGMFQAIDQMYIAGTDGVFSYSGGYTFDRISQNLDDMYLGRDGLIQQSDMPLMDVTYDEENQLLMIFCRDTAAADDNNNLILLYNIGEGSWWPRPLTFPLSGVGIFRSSVPFPWGSLQGSWGGQQWKWGGESLSAETPKIIVGALLDGIWRTGVFGVAGDDFGVDIPWSIETKDFDSYSSKIRTDFFEAVYSGTPELSYSVDRGKTWTVLDSALPAAVETRYRFDHQIVTPVIRYRLRGVGGGGLVNETAVKFREESSF